MKISIDFWGTLGKSSPEFYPKKIELLQEYVSVDQTAIEKGFEITKKELNCWIEKTGFQPSLRMIFKTLTSNIKNGYSNNSKILNPLIEEYQLLAKKFHPIIYSESTKGVIQELYKEGHDLVLSCNTMLIIGEPIVDALTDWEIEKCFSHLMFSCDGIYAKPHQSMYQNSDFHIGDNPITDGKGAELAGSIPIIINSNNQTIQDALNIIRNCK